MPFLKHHLQPQAAEDSGKLYFLQSLSWSCSFWGKRIWAGPDAFTPFFHKSAPGRLISKLKEHPLSIKGNLQLGLQTSELSCRHSSWLSLQITARSKGGRGADGRCIF